jgi:hypothetical protein
MRQVGSAMIVQLQLRQPPGHAMLRLQHQAAHFAQGMHALFVQRVFRQLPAQMFQRAVDVVMQALEFQHRIGKRPQPARLHQRFPGQAEQAIQMQRGNAQHLFVRFVRRLVRGCFLDFVQGHGHGVLRRAWCIVAA